jgi:signal transduction histidine kinase
MWQTENLIPILLFNLFFILFIVGIVIFIRQYKIKKKEHNMLLHHQHEEHQKELLTTELEIQKQTMQHIGREIHDNIGQKLTLASLYTQQLAYENKAPQINGNIESISSIINESLSELRALSKSLTDNTIDSHSISSLLESECVKINELQILSVTFSSNAKAIKLDYETKSVLLRITQEFIQNSIKHANCQNIIATLSHNTNLLQLKLEDDGKGFDVDTIFSTGIGLSNMKKRTEIIGGNYQLQSNSNGTNLTIDIPLKS